MKRKTKYDPVQELLKIKRKIEGLRDDLRTPTDTTRQLNDLATEVQMVINHLNR